MKFHRQISIPPENDILGGLVYSIINLLHVMKQVSSSIPEVLAHVRSSYQAIVRAIEQPAAREAM